MVKTPLFLALAFLATCGAGALTTEEVPSQPTVLQAQPTVLQATSTAAVVSDDACPLTIPPQPGLVPPEPYSPQAPDLYQAVWYGTSALWTMLAPEGEVWWGLPRDDDGTLGNKTFWWSDSYSGTNVGEAPITVSGQQLDGSATFEVGGTGSAGGGFREDIGSFILVPVGIPAGGCWELTARYRDAELSYVVLVQG